MIPCYVGINDLFLFFLLFVLVFVGGFGCWGEGRMYPHIHFCIKKRVVLVCRFISFVSGSLGKACACYGIGSLP